MDDLELAVPAGAQEAFDVIEPYKHPAPLLIVISGPSGVGKDSVIRRMRELEHDFQFVVTATDREPRAGEEHGVDYWFVSTAEFERMIAEDELFEYARVYGQYKGVPKTHARKALNSGQDVIMRLDVQGAATIRTKVPESVTIFLSPPSPNILIARLQRRAGDSVTQVQKRLETAISEMHRLAEFDYVVINREGYLDQTIQHIVSIIKAEKSRTARRQTVI